jgi:hypothetical protein
MRDGLERCERDYRASCYARTSTPSSSGDEPSAEELVRHGRRNDQLERPVSPNAAGVRPGSSWSAGCAFSRAKELVRPGIIGTEHAASERTTVDALVRTILEPYVDDASRERISASGPDVIVGATAVTSLALALHESATNAVKYGALSEPNGAIRIKWEMQGDDFRLEWEETDGPAIVVTPNANGFGSILTEHSIIGQLKGKIEYDWQQKGLKLRMTVPLDRLSV